MVIAIVDGVLLPSHATLATKTEALQAAATSFCASPTEPGLTAVRAAWDEARSSLKHVDVFAFGPYSDTTLRYGAKLDYWPVRPSSVEELLAGTTTLDAGYLSGLGTPARGIPVIEWLIYPPSTTDAPLAAFTDPAAGARRCAYVTAASTDAMMTAVALRDAWTAFAPELKTAGSGSTIYPRLSDAVNELYNRTLFLVENVRELKLGKPAGKATTGIPQPDLVESRPSGRSLKDVEDNLAAVGYVLDGHLPGALGLGFLDHLRRLNASLVPMVATNLEAARAAVAAIPMPLSIAVVEQPVLVEDAYQAVKALHRLLAVEVASALGATVTFNDTDGD